MRYKKTLLSRVREKAVASGRSNKKITKSSLFRGAANTGFAHSIGSVYHRGATGKWKKKLR